MQNSSFKGSNITFRAATRYFKNGVATATSRTITTVTCTRTIVAAARVKVIVATDDIIIDRIKLVATTCARAAIVRKT